ncbi:hypothetical protein P3X46_015185 [Hevea brasiliensis]|uniref:NAB domain-containing protein n=1 Tax=Hevea brasiliensis TaxID=3981 RepID=A0ABQ9LXB6_HEVBR|nr:protein NETWORKED 3A [Hevea brasiliensis]XP_021660544.2 protein NETWORKED 3A [Hevea brasiliensis]XP_021660545.2 protein NETWORKED 3A [Hevea brasiliensis]KAJ9171882.1 hypothetical protein P3X46_015185 [Hevea brasiliensis]
MVEMINKDTSHWWWFESHQSSNRSPWLQSTLCEVDRKTKAMLKLIEEDADSFAQRAEMYYKKRPELISMVEDFYRTHRSLAEQYDLLKSDSGNRLTTIKYQRQKLTGGMNKIYDSHSDSETYSAESEVEDPGQEEETEFEEEMGEVEEPEQKIETGEVEVSGSVCNDEVMKMQDEIEILKEENRIQSEQLLQKDEEKREVIRQLSLAIEVLKLENVQLRKHVAKGSPKKTSPLCWRS